MMSSRGGIDFRTAADILLIVSGILQAVAMIGKQLPATNRPGGMTCEPAIIRHDRPANEWRRLPPITNEKGK